MDVNPYKRIFGIAASTYKMYAAHMNQEKHPSHADLIRRWPTVKDFARDMALNVGTVEQWISRNSIPGRYWAWMVLSAQKRGIDEVTLAHLARAVSFREVAA